MGGVAQQEMPHKAVAQSFVKVYYQVASQYPHQLALLYGEDSVLAHGEIHAVGPEAIRSVANSLPVVGPKNPSLFSIDAQVMASEGIVVVVLGCLSNGRLFSQTFLLERKPVTDGKLVFVCRNDIFRLMPVDPAAAAKAYEPTPIDDLHNVDSAPEAGAKPSTANSTSPQTVVVDTPPSGNSQQNAQAVPETVTSPVAVPIPTKNSASALENKIPGNNLHKSTTVSTDEAIVASAEEPVNPTPAADPGPVNETPQPPRPKTWASIVSKTSVGVPSVTAPSASLPTVASPGDKATAPPLSDRMAPANKPQQAVGSDADISNKSGSPRQHQKPDDSRKLGGPQYAQRNGSGYHQYGALKPGQRQFGPSAVLQLNSIGDDWNGKHRELSVALREEFSRYGHVVRHVEVKSPRGIVFVEYDTIEGVEAAVKAWKEPRSDGKFAGRKLSVTEKRNMRNQRAVQHGAPRGRAQHNMGRGRRGGAGGHHRQSAQSGS